MTTSTLAIIEELHKTFCTLTGTEPRQKVWERAWYDFIQAGYTQDDLRCVLVWIIRENKRNDYKRSSSILKLIGNDFTVFDSYLAEARAVERNHKPKTPKQEVLAAFRGHHATETMQPARVIGDILKQAVTPNKQ